MIRLRTPVLVVLLALLALPARGGERFELREVFDLEYAADPQIAPDGERVVYRRVFMDVMRDRRRSHLWSVRSDGSDHRPLVAGEGSYGSPRFSPDGTRLAYVASDDGDGPSQIHVRWLDSGADAQLAQLRREPADLSWSPDGRWLAFTMRVPEKSEPFVELPEKPEGASWAEPPRVVEGLIYRADGAGYLEPGHRQVFVLPADGGTPRQLTSGPYDHRGPLAWADAATLILSANRRSDADYEPLDTEIYALAIGDGTLTPLTDRRGPDADPAVSPDGGTIAYTGFDDRYQGYQVTRLWLMRRDGSERRALTAGLDRDVEQPVWSAAGDGLFFRFSDRGNTKVAFVSLAGEVSVLAGDVGGTSIGRPYASGSFSVAGDGRFAFTHTRPDHPADVAIGRRGEAVRRLTRLNDDLFAHQQLGEVEEIVYGSSFDGRRIQGWIVKPPDFDPTRTYPLILEIHGGPFADYGDRFAAEIQLYAAAGYVVFYANPRGSTGYGEEFGNLIHHNYPGQDYDDLMSGVDAVIARGYVDAENLFVTGGSGGGVLSAWIVGKTDRFRAAVVAKPVINWYSFVLTADGYNFFYKYWFPGFPWDHPEHYLKRSPLSLAGNVKTPTMILTGEVDYRTPISESEQFYQALKLRRVDAVLVRVPGASHGIANRPSQLIAKVAHVLEWFERHKKGGDGD